MSYADDARSAYDDIRQSGGPIIITREGVPVIDEVTNTQTGGEPEAYPHWALILSASPGMGDTFETGLRVRTASRKLIVPSYKLPIVPEEGNSVVFSGDTWEIKSVDPLAPHGGRAIMYTLMVSK